MPDTDELVTHSRPRPQVVRLTLSRPAKLNALNSPLVEQLHAHLRAISADMTCRVVVLSGAGRGFCAGYDLDGYGVPAGTEHLDTVQRNWQIQRHIASLAQEIRRLPQPVVAAVNGPAAGGGLALVCASDVRVAASTATFSTSFIRTGASGCDIGTSWLLPRLVGAARAHELMLTSRRVLAEEALAIGLVTDVVDPDELEERVDTVVDDLLAAHPLALPLTKQAMWLALEIPSFDAAVELENRQQVLTTMVTDPFDLRAAYR